MRAHVRPGPLLCLLALAACDRDGTEGRQGAAPVEAALANAPDPAIREALAGPIMSDPALAQRSNDLALRPPPRPADGLVPDETIALPRRTADATPAPAPAATGDCPECRAAEAASTLAQLSRATHPACSVPAPSAQWAARLPASLPLHPDARVIEAAGTDERCRLRAVRFTLAAPLSQLLDWTATHARRGGFAIAHAAREEVHALRGTRGGERFVLVAREADGRTRAELVVDAER